MLIQLYDIELIDTLWNVNTYLVTIKKLKSGINRYIMECKCASISFTRSYSFELIDTLWNVNLVDEADSSIVRR